jgi:hypothetical protein
MPAFLFVANRDCDPSTRDRQGNDIGASYRSAIFYENDEQKRVADDTIANVDASGIWPGKVVTELTPAAISGRPSRSIRITWSAILPATPAISRRLRLPFPETELESAEARGQPPHRMRPLRIAATG